MIRFTVWQCTDFCCEDREFSKRWWNISRQVDGTWSGYDSYSTWREAMGAAT